MIMKVVLVTQNHLGSSQCLENVKEFPFSFYNEILGRTLIALGQPNQRPSHRPHGSSDDADWCLHSQFISVISGSKLPPR